MQCEICQKKEATIHLTEITDGVRTELHVCEICAAEQGITVKSQMPLNELLSNLLSSQPGDEEMRDPQEKDLMCPQCGFTLEQFRKEAVLGCPNDYEVFEKSLLPLIDKAHDGKTTHCGKVPTKAPQDVRKKSELLALKQQLDAAVLREDYELAAKLRDQIAQIQ
jgi:protein arginine kinase activator